MTRNLSKPTALAALLLALLLGAPPVLAQGALIHVTAESTHGTATPGGFQEVGCRIDNLSGETLLIQITGTVTYADGDQQTIYRPGQPIVLEPDTSFILFIFFIVPADAALGTAVFECSVRALGVAGGMAQESDTSTFEVVAG